MTLREFLLEFFREVLKNLQASLRTPEDEPSLNLKNLSSFSFPEELPVILSIAERFFPKSEVWLKGQDVPLNPYALILAIREAEKGRKGFEFGVVKAKDTDLKTQCEWACAILRKNFERFEAQSEEKDFIAFLGKHWAPIGAENDPKGLNRYWTDNVRFFYRRFNRG